jgi:hypothetical protein
MQTTADHRLNGQLLPKRTGRKADHKPTKKRTRWDADRVRYWSATAAP